MTKAPLVSVIIPAFNRAAVIGETLGSVREQVYRNLEIVVVDDGSTDETAAVVAALQLEDRRISLVSQKNRGVAAARQAGFESSRGELIQYLDSDDLLDRWKIDRQVAAISLHPEFGLAFGPMFHLRDGVADPVAARHSGSPIDTLFPAMLKERLWDTGSTLVRRTVCEAVGPWASLQFEEDWEYDARIARSGARALFVPDAYSYYRLRELDAMSGGSTPEGLRSRAVAREMILGHARAAGVAADSEEMHSFSRSLFLLARQCASAGLIAEARDLLELSRSISSGADTWIYALASSIAGWRTIGRFASWADRFR